MKVSDRFISVLQWVQFGFSAWYFFREAKVFRLPFAFLSSLWNGGLSQTQKRKRKLCLLTSKADLNYSTPQYPDMEEVLTARFSIQNSERGMTTLILNGEKQYYLLTQQVYLLLCDWLYETRDTTNVKNKDYLLLGVFLYDKASVEECIDHFLEDKYYKIEEETCIIDQSSTDELNKNFIRLLGTVPLMLQAKNLPVESLALSAFLIVLDWTSYYANLFWKVFKQAVFLTTKYALNELPLAMRNEIMGVLSSASEGFIICDKSTDKIYSVYLESIIFVADNSNLTFDQPDFCNPLFAGSDHRSLSSMDTPVVDAENRYRINNKDIVLSSENYLKNGFIKRVRMTIAFNGNSAEFDFVQAEYQYINFFFDAITQVHLLPVNMMRKGSLHVVDPIECVSKRLYKGATVFHWLSKKKFTVSDHSRTQHYSYER